MKETGKVIRWVVVGLMCAGGTTLIWRASMPKGAPSRHHPRGQTLKGVNDGQRHLSASQLQEARSADLSNSGVSSRARVNDRYNKLPLSFEANNGQTDPRVKFLSRGRGYNLFLTSDEAVLTLKKATGSSGQQRALGNPKLAMLRSKFARGSWGQATDDERMTTHGLVPPLIQAPKSQAADVVPLAPSPLDLAPAVLRMKLLGANPSPRVKGLQELPGKSNYFLGKDPGKWRTNVPNYAKVAYRDVYAGVDLVYYGNQGQLEYDFIVAPGADPNQIALDVGAGLVPAQGRPQGAPLHIDRNGDLLAGTPGGEVVFHKPVVYQIQSTVESRRSKGEQHSAPADANNKELQTKKLLDGSYVLKGNQVTFEVAFYDRTKPLVIDPVLKYSTYLGGTGDDLISPPGVQSIAVDPEGSAYVIGITDSTDFPVTAGAFQTKFAGSGNVFFLHGDAFVTKLNASGDALVYSTYLGGTSDDEGDSVAVDPAGNAYLAGVTLSTDFPITKGAFQPTCASCSSGTVDTFAAKLSRDGSALIYSTYIGGNDADLFPMIVIDRHRNMYIEGTTYSADYPTTPGAFQPACASCANGLPDTYVTKLNPQGTGLVYSTYLGGSDVEVCGAQIAVDHGGSVYVNGFTCSTDFPTLNSIQAYAGGCDAFLTKLNPAGNALVYSTYLGGSNFDFILGTAIDFAGNAYVSGATLSSDFPTTPGAFQTDFVGGTNCPFPPCGDAFVTKINPSGTALVYSTYLGGTGDDFVEGMAVDFHGNAFVGGATTSTDFPTLNAFQPANAGGYDIFVTEVNRAGNALAFSTYLGGSGEDITSAIALDMQRRDVYVGGYTTSSDFPTVNAAQPQFGGGTYDAIVAKISPGNPPAPASSPGLSRPSKANSNPGVESPGANRTVPIVNWKMDMARKAAR